MKRSLFTLVFALFTSVIAIGSPLPDRPTEDFDDMKVAVIGCASEGFTTVVQTLIHQGADVVVIHSDSKAIETYKIKTTDLDNDLLFLDDRIPIESIQFDEVKQAYKPYQMPRYKYKPTIKPPRIALHR